MAGYLFLSNGTKPSTEEQSSRDEVELSSVSRPCLKTALSMGYDVVFGTNRDNPNGLDCELPVSMYDSHTYRSLFDFKSNKIAYNNLMTVLKRNNIEVIHCNTPVGGLIGRICGRKANIKKIIYTAHGFHFYEGAPLVNRTIFKWAEQLMARWTDAIITMNDEDYEAAKKFKLRRNGKVFKVHGVGIDLKEYENIIADKNSIRKELGIDSNDTICISAGDLVKRKNYAVAIKALGINKDPSVHFLICGSGQELENLKQLAIECDVENQVHFLGFRSDIKELFLSSDLFLFSSSQEGLPRSLMEAMACGLPAVVSRIRGNVDLIEHNKGGFLCDSQDPNSFAKAINSIVLDKKMKLKMSNWNKEKIKEFDVSVVQKEIEEIYKEVLVD